ncbi:cyclic nucleotide-binding domain-containing protein [Rhizobium giardinii]|uniref:cyclic nucleotide-binding domain-containing protein n=1 Tax=Rhizobium giardinii TaxID=56731 RepID=UPI003D6F4D0E
MTSEAIPAFVSINLLGVAGIIAWYFQGRSRPTARLILQIIVFSAMTAAVVLAGRNPFRFDAPHLDGAGSLVISAKILWWTHLAWAAIGFVRIYIVLEGKPKEARLLQDLIVALVYLGVLLSVMAFVFGVPIGTLLATSGVVAIILGLALQNTLGDVFSGIALTLGRPYVLGDWILLADGTEGRVVASNWRSTYLLTASHNLVVLPNSVLAKQGLTNISKPDESHQIMLSVRVLPTQKPSSILEVMRTVLANCNSIIHEPTPEVAIKGINAAGLEIELLFQVTSPSQRIPARNEVIDMVYRHCRASGLRLAMPLTTSFVLNEARFEPTDGSASDDPIHLLTELGLPERERLGSLAIKRTFAQREIIARKGDLGTGLTIIQTGIVLITRGTHERRLAPGDCFGGVTLVAGEAEPDEIKALTRVTVHEIKNDALDRLLAAYPDILMGLANELPHQDAKATTYSERSSVTPRGRAELVHTVRSLFRRDQL